MNKIKTHITPHLRFSEFSDKWKSKKLGEVSEINRGKSKHRPRNAKFLYGGKHPFVQTGDIRGANLYLDSYTQTYSEKGLAQSKLWDEGTLCITIAANIAETTILKIKACFPDSIIGLIPYKEKTIVLFLKYQFDKFKIDIQKLSEGIAQSNLNKEKLSKIEFLFPQLPEQQKIASFLTVVDTKITQLTKKKELLEQYKKGVMQQIFNQETDKGGSQTPKENKKNSEQIRFNDEKGNKYSKWENKTLKEVANFRRGSFPQPYGLSKWYDNENGTPFIQVYDVDKNMLLKPSTKNKISQLGAEQSVFVEKGTLVITIQGSIGRIAKTQYDAYVDRTLLIFQSYKSPLNIDYFKYVVFLLFEIEKRKAPGGIIKTITKERLSSFNVIMPCIEEQTKIANFLSSIDAKISQVANQLEKTQTFKKGLLQQLFV